VHRLSAGVVTLLLAIATTSSFALGIGFAPPQPPPPDLAASIAKARLDGSVASWCRGNLRPGAGRAYAVALALEKGGRYIVIDGDAKVVTLATFSGGADLSCYTPSEARRLNRTIAASETIAGRIAPRGNTTVVCGFVGDTEAVCWQYSPARREFVTIGGWTT
jgi:hypothetical protein